MVLPELAVFDGWVADPVLLEELYLHARAELGRTDAQSAAQRSYWWDGDVPGSPVHRYIRSTSERLCRCFDLQWVACEWRVLGRQEPEWYLERDEDLHAETGELRHPALGTNLFLSGAQALSGLGGALLGGAFSINTDDTGKTADQIYPVWNRLLIYTCDRLHTVREFEGVRLGLAVNFWDHAPASYLATLGPD
jgi:hypothetical protein